MELQIYHTVNAGLYLWNGRSGLMIDTLHKGKGIGFSDTKERYVQMMRAGASFFSGRNDLLFTHAHADHYDAGLVEEYRELFPDCLVWGPGVDKCNVEPVVLEEGARRLNIREYGVYAFAALHDGKGFADCPHCSYLIQWEGQNLWVSGDAALSPELASAVGALAGDMGVSAAFVMVYQIGGSAGREFLKQLSPRRVFLYHLPYEADDSFHYHPMAKGLVERYRRAGGQIEILPPDSFVP